MIDYTCFCQIKSLQEKGLTAGQIAHKIGLHTQTVRLWMARPRYERRRSTRSRRSSKLDPYKTRIAQLLAECDRYTACQIFQTLRDEGYEGGYTLVRGYVATVRPSSRRVYRDLVFAPGEAAQVDFGECGLTQVGKTRRKLYVFVMVLCHSRLMYVEFILRQSLEHFLACHRNAFEAIGGVPGAVICDRTRCAVIGTDRFGDPVPHPRYKDISDHYRFKIRPCKARSPWEKGQVENGVKYVKSSFMNGRAVEPFEAVRTAATQWLERTANQRVHKTTRDKPAVLFDQVERAALQPLPDTPYDCSLTLTKLVTHQARFSYDGNRYSVPPQYAPGRIQLHILPDRLTVCADGEVVARHVRCYERGARAIVDPAHDIELTVQRRRGADRKLTQRFLALGAEAVEYYQGLQLTQVHPLVHVRKIMALDQRHDRDDLLRAMADAAAHKAFRAEYIANLLEFREAVEPPSPLRLTRRQDLLEIDLEPPSLDTYQRALGENKE